MQYYALIKEVAAAEIAHRREEALDAGAPARRRRMRRAAR
jgi:hypothetical protein